MAVPTGSGTETLHSHLFEDVDATQTLILGVQHHIYTVLSIIVKCHVLNATTDKGYINLVGYDAHGSASGQTMQIAAFNIQVHETYVWNDKFSFNGSEPSSTPAIDASGQIAIAAQGSTNYQYLAFTQDSVTDDYDVFVTFLDQDWT
jgi:putative flippase GtrA